MGYIFVWLLDLGFLEIMDIFVLLIINYIFVYMLLWIVLFEKFVLFRVKIFVLVGYVVCYLDLFLGFKYDFVS